VWPAADGRHLYVNAYMAPYESELGMHCLVVDLDTGAARQVGARADYWCFPNGPVIARRDYLASRGETRREWRHYYDTRTGVLVKSGWSDMRLPEVEALLPPRREVRALDRRHVARLRYARTLERTGRWLVKPGDGPWELYDPDSGARAPCAVQRPHFVLPDGRVVATDGGEAALVDPETSARTPLGVNAAYVGPYAWTPGGYVVVLVEHEQRYRYARLDPRTGALVWLTAANQDAFAWRIVTALDDETLLMVHDNRTIVRLRCGSGTRKVVFPR
jgi:hypothetical protein